MRKDKSLSRLEEESHSSVSEKQILMISKLIPSTVCGKAGVPNFLKGRDEW